MINKNKTSDSLFASYKHNIKKAEEKILINMPRNQVPDNLLEKHIQLSNLKQVKNWQKIKMKLDNLEGRASGSPGDLFDDDGAAEDDVSLQEICMKNLGDHVLEYNAVLADNIALFGEESQRLFELTLREEAMEELENHVVDYNERLNSQRGIVPSEEAEHLCAESEIAYEISQLHLLQPIVVGDGTIEETNAHSLSDKTLGHKFSQAKSSVEVAKTHSCDDSSLQQHAMMEFEECWDEHQGDLKRLHGSVDDPGDALVDHQCQSAVAQSSTATPSSNPSSDLNLQLAAAIEFDQMWHRYNRLYLEHHQVDVPPGEENDIQLRVETFEELCQWASDWNEKYGLVYDE